MTPKEQKGKHRKRKRSWHRGPLEDQRFDEALRRLEQTECPETDTQQENPHRKGETQ